MTKLPMHRLKEGADATQVLLPTAPPHPVLWLFTLSMEFLVKSGSKVPVRFN